MLLRLLLLALSLSTGFRTTAQTYLDSDYYLIDSLRFDELSTVDSALIAENMEKYHAAQHDTTRLGILNVIVNRMVSDKWGAYAKVMLDMSEPLVNKKVKDSSERAYYEYIYSASLGNYGLYLSHHGDNKGAINYYLKSLKLCEDIKNYNGISAAYNNLAFQYEQMGRISEALDYHHRSLKMDLYNNDTAGITASYNNLGLLYTNIEEYEMAQNNFLICYEYLKDYGDPYRLAITYGNLASGYGNLDQIDSAVFYGEKALEIQREIGDHLGMSVSMGTLGVHYLVLGDTIKGKTYLSEGMKTAKSVDYFIGISSGSNALASLLFAQHDYKNALFHAKNAYDIASQRNYIEQKLNSSKTLFRIYQEQNRYKDALEMHIQYTELQDSLKTIDNKTLAIRKDLEQEFDQKALADSLSNAQEKALIKIRHEEEKEQQAQQTLFMGILFIVALVFGGFIFNRFRITRRQKGIIEAQKTEVDLAYGQLEVKNREIMDSINYARRIQTAILPPDKIVQAYLQNSFIYYLPKDVVAGDFYWLEHIGKTTLFAAADCTGHGVPGAMVSVVCHNALNRAVREFDLSDPGKILNQTREIVVGEFEKSEEQVKDGMDIALCAIEGKKLQYAGANNPLWIVRKGEYTEEAISIANARKRVYTENGYTIFEIMADKQPVGKFDNAKDFITKTIDLSDDDTLYIFSDGYVDQFGGERGKKMKSRGFKSFLTSIQHENMATQRSLISSHFETWKGDFEQVDDVCIIGLKV